MADVADARDAPSGNAGRPRQDANRAAPIVAFMELGITSFAETHPDPATGDVLDHGVRLRNVIAEVEMAEAVGLDVYGLGEHHRIDMAASAPAITLAAAAARTDRIRLSSAVIVLSSADPVRTFQDFATLDLISSGRAELLVGRGSFIESFPLFGYSLDDYNELFAEKLELLVQLSRNGRVTWKGRFRTALEDQAVYPAPATGPTADLGWRGRNAGVDRPSRPIGSAGGAGHHRWRSSPIRSAGPPLPAVAGGDGT